MEGIIIGVDPGLKGGVAIIDDNLGLLNAFPIPTISETKRVGKKDRTFNRVDNNKLFSLIQDEISTHYGKKIIGIIEDVTGRSRDSASNSFRFGESFGCLLCVLDLLCHEIRRIHPATWKNSYGLFKSGKKGSFDMATKMAGHNKFWPLKKHDGVAEAFLIASTQRGLI